MVSWQAMLFGPDASEQHGQNPKLMVVAKHPSFSTRVVRQVSRESKKDILISSETPTCARKNVLSDGYSTPWVVETT